MNAWSPKQTWITGLAILVLTNAVALGGVAYNRSGEPGASLVLTERELRRVDSGGFNRDNSGISLAVEWRVLTAVSGENYAYRNRWAAVDWLHEEKLRELGFRTQGVEDTAESRARFNRGLAREVWLVLEYDGPASQAMRQRVKAFTENRQTLAQRNRGNAELKKRAATAGKQWKREQQGASRLFVIDAGHDADVLRQRYQDNARYIIMRGQVRARVYKNDDDTLEVRGHIQGLAVTSVNVPLAFRPVFASLPGERNRSHAGPPRYRVTLANGRRHEPWIVAVEAIR